MCVIKLYRKLRFKYHGIGNGKHQATFVDTYIER